MRSKFFLLILAVFIPKLLSSQSDTTSAKINFEFDYRFRIEQDYNSRKSDGTFREDRTRLRYRLRAGAEYSKNGYSFGARLRTGDPNKQQDPQLTLGKGLEEFGTLPIGFEKAYFQYEKNNYKFWLGKNKFPFAKDNELFWSDNVFPEGVTIQKKFKYLNGPIDSLTLVGGHYIIGSNNSSFSKDAYFQGLQSNLQFKNIKFLSGIFLFRNIANIPDGAHTFEIDYSILHLGLNLKHQKFQFHIDYYNNLENYDSQVDLLEEFRNQKTGYTLSAQYGTNKIAKTWMFKLTYTYLQKYSILDYMAQNDWARWDYSNYNSPDGRLSNMNGIEAVVHYNITDKINLVGKYYFVHQLIPIGNEKETGQRVRFDINIKM